MSDKLLVLNTIDSYNKLRDTIEELIEDLNEIDKQGYNTRQTRTEIERIKTILHKMNNITMSQYPIDYKRVMGIGEFEPWEKIGISRSTYYRDMRRARQNDDERNNE